MVQASDWNYIKIKTALKNRQIMEPWGFKNFVSENFRREISEKISFDGSMKRAEKLMKKRECCPVLYGKMYDEYFAIWYIWEGEERLTFFIRNIPYEENFAKVLVAKYPHLPYQIALAISLRLPHDEYYVTSSYNYYDDPYMYSNMIINMATMARGSLDAGEYLQDILNGETLVFSVNHKRYINIDDEMPSCFVIDRVIYIYNPQSNS